MKQRVDFFLFNISVSIQVLAAAEIRSRVLPLKPSNLPGNVVMDLFQPDGRQGIAKGTIAH